jgi:hypothetical protein
VAQELETPTKPLGEYTVGEVVGHTLRLVDRALPRRGIDLKPETQEETDARAAALRDLEDMRALYFSWYSDPDLSRVALKLDESIEITFKNAESGMGDVFVAPGVGAGIRLPGKTGEEGFFQSGGAYDLTRGGHEAGLFGDLFGENVDWDGLRKRNAGLDAYERLRAAEIYTQPGIAREDGREFVRLSNGEEIDIPGVGGALTYDIELANGEKRTVEFNGELLDALSAEAQGDWVGSTIVGGLWNRLVHKRRIATPYGPRFVPSITGNEAIDYDLYQRPEIQRAIERGRGPSLLQKLGQATLGVTEFAALQRGTSGAIKGIAGASRGIAGRLAPSVSRNELLKFAGTVGKRVGTAALEGARPRMAAPGMAFDMRQLGEQIYYESVRGAINDDSEPADWVSNGFSMWLGQYMLATTARIGRRIGISQLRNGRVDRTLKAISAGKWNEAKLQGWSKRFEKVDEAVYRAGATAIQNGRKATEAELLARVEAGMFGELRTLAKREALAQLADTTFVATAFGAWHGAQVAAARDGKDFDAIGPSEKLTYWREGLFSEEMAASLVSFVGFQGLWSAAMFKRGITTPEQRESVQQMSRWLLGRTRANLDGVEPALGAAALFGGSLDPSEQAAVVAQRIAKIRGEAEGDIYAGDLQASITKTSRERLLQIHKKENGPRVIRKAIEAAPIEELKILETTLSVDPNEFIRNRRDGLGDLIRLGQIHGMVRLEISKEARGIRGAAPIETEYVDFAGEPVGQYPKAIGPELPELPVPEHLPPREMAKLFTLTLRPIDRDPQARWRSGQARTFTIGDTEIREETTGARNFWALSGRGEADALLFDWAPNGGQGLENAMRLALIREGRLKATESDIALVKNVEWPGLEEVSRLVREKRRMEKRAARVAEREAKRLEAIEAAGEADKRAVRRYMERAQRRRRAIEKAGKREREAVERFMRKAEAARARERKKAELAEKEEAWRAAKYAREVRRYTKLAKVYGTLWLEGRLSVTKDPLLREAIEDVLTSPELAAPVRPPPKPSKTYEALGRIVAETVARAPTTQEVVSSVRRIVDALSVVPEFATKSPEERIAGHVTPTDFISAERLETKASEAEAMAKAIIADLPAVAPADRSPAGAARRERIRAAKEAAAGPKAAPLENAEAHWLDDDLRGYFRVGADVFRSRGAERRGRIGLLMNVVFDTAFRAAAKDPRAAAQRQAAMIGMILQGGVSRASDANVKLIGAIFGVSPESVLELRQGLVEYGRARYGAETLERAKALVDNEGRRLIGDKQLALADLQDLLALYALGAPIEPSGRHTFDPNAHLAEIVRWWKQEKGRESTIASMIAAGADKDPASIAAHADAEMEVRLTAIGNALSGSWSGVRVRDPLSQIAGRIAVSLGIGTHHARLDTPVPSMGNAPLRDVAVAALERISGRKLAPVEELLPEQAVGLAPPPGVAPAAEAESAAAPVEPRKISATDAYVASANLIEEVLSALGATRDKNAPRGTLDELLFLRGLVERDPFYDGLLAEAGHGPEQIEALREKAVLAQRFTRQMVRNFIAQTSGEHAPEALKMFDLEMQALGIEATGGNVADVPEVYQHLKKFDRIGEDGRLAPDFEHNLARQVQRALIESEQASANGGRLVELSERKILLYGGIGPEMVKESIRVAAALMDFSMGFVDRIQNYPVKLKPQDVHAPPAFGLNALLKRLETGSPKTWAGRSGRKLAMTIAKSALKYYQPITRGKRGVMSERVRAGNVEWQRGLADATAKGAEIMGRFAETVNGTFERLKLTSLERHVVQQALENQSLTRIGSAEEFGKVVGVKEYERLWSAIEEIGRLFIDVGDELVALGLIEPAAQRWLRGVYYPHKVMQWAFGPDGPTVYWNDSGARGPVAASAEFERMGTTHEQSLARIYDPAIILPLEAAQISKRAQIFSALEHAATHGAVIPKAEYDALPEIVRAQYQRAANKGLKRVPGGWEPVFTIEEEASMSPTERVAEIDRRRRVKFDAALMAEFIERERNSRGGEGQPAMTPKLKVLLDTLETGYVSKHVAQEMSLLIQQADLSADPGGDWIARLTQEWRKMRTVQNPSHWILQMATNWSSNAVTGKVPMSDLILGLTLGEGTYAEGAADINRWFDESARGIRHGEMSKDAQLFGRFMRYTSGATYQRLFLEPVTARDLLGFFPDLPDQIQGEPIGDQSRAMSALFAGARRAGRGWGTFSDKLRMLQSAPDPKSRAQALRALHGAYNLHEIFWKYAAFKEGLKRGLDERSAAEWAAEGTGDYADRSTLLLRFSSSFSTEFGELSKGARTRMGKPRDPTAWDWIKNVGFGGPFWLYSASMIPTLARKRMSWRGLSATAATLLAIRAIGQAFGGDEDELAEAAAGHGQTFALGVDRMTLEAFAAEYPDVKIPSPSGAGYPSQLELTAEQWAKLAIAWGENAAHLASLGLIGERRPEAEFISLTRGPTLGGESTMIDWGDFMPDIELVNRLSHLWNVGDAKPFNADKLSDYGVGFVPIMVVAGLSRMYEAARGVKGKKRATSAATMVSDLMEEFSAPLGGGVFPAIASRQHRIAREAFAWDGRSLADVLEGMPPSLYRPDLAEALSTVGARSLLPVRRLPRTSAEPREMNAADKLFSLLGWRQRSELPGSEYDQAAARRMIAIKTAAKNLFSRAYREYIDTKVPIDAIYSRSFNLEPDLVIDPTSGLATRISDSPISDFGKFLRAQSDNPEEQALWVRDALRAINERMPFVVSLVSSPDGLVYRRDVDPALHDRIVEAAWDAQYNREKLMRYLWRLMQNEPEHEGALARLWVAWGFPSMKVSGGSLDVWDKAQRWVAERWTDAPAMYDVSDIDIREVLGPPVYDVAPVESVLSLERRPSDQYQTLLGGKR